MVGCVPALYSFWSSFIANSTLYSRISTILSTLSLPLSTTRSNRTYGSNKSKPSNISQAAPRGVPSTSTENIVLVAESEDNVSLRKQLSNQHQGGVFEYPLHNLSKQNP
ncbi:hypothetical protein F5Y10DRAFT_134954 [Nemania abortiva]|nr:hypothetical protein F5Y10DRAFT_134954 [Nemania abortiva]